jgi:hypothetical protein
MGFCGRYMIYEPDVCMEGVANSWLGVALSGTGET